MSDRVGVRALQQHASDVVARAADGTVIEITLRGRPIAQLSPIARTRLGALVDAGLARPARRTIRDLPPPLPATEGPTLAALLAESRSGER